MNLPLPSHARPFGVFWITAQRTTFRRRSGTRITLNSAQRKLLQWVNHLYDQLIAGAEPRLRVG